ncbi:CbrC family protein [Streptomyces sp. NPDC058287]|uniref:CbrC family protein n=1 Tax=Streptomyces sp. NPDC058287 TaxID=3346423 RepID=UPI0036E3BFC4
MIRTSRSSGTTRFRARGFHAWQDPHWLVHCHDAAAFVVDGLQGRGLNLAGTEEEAAAIAN